MMKYRFRTRPYRHQHDALKRILKQPFGGALLMEPRTGKTKTTIDYLSILYLQGKIKRAVIVCPTRVMGVWAREFHTHAPASVPFHLSVWDAEARRAGVPSSQAGVLNVLVVNYEAFATPGRRLASGRRSKSSGRFKTRALIWKWMNGEPTAGVLDESHKIKSASGKAANLIVSMRDTFAYRLILTGTPVTKANRIFDTYMQWQFLNPSRFSDLPTLSSFKQHYGRWKQTPHFPKYLGPRNIEDLKRRIEQDSVIVRRDECFDLPPREDIIQHVELGEKTRAAYREMAKEMIIQLENEKVATAAIKLVQNLRLSQITSGFVTDENGDLHRFGFEKLDALETLLQERIELGEKLVVAARYKVDMDLIESLGHQLGIPVWSIRGGKTREESDRALHEFQAYDQDSGLMVLQPASAALGIDLSSASHMVWYSHTPSWVNYSQTCDRIALSRSSTTFTHLIARHSVDEVLFHTLKQDGDLAKAVMGDPSILLEGLDLSAGEAFTAGDQPLLFRL